MKIRHAAALALVGWYLMAPSVSYDKEGHVKAPPAAWDTSISHWDSLGAFDSASTCQAVQHGVKADIAKKLKEKFHASADIPGMNSALSHATSVEQLDWLAFAATRLAAECIATDDPRLKGN
jgi:hypothetical protein